MNNNYDAMYETALKKILEYPVGTIFLAKSPFDSVEWNALDRRDKTGYGRYFKNKVLTGSAPNIELCGEAKNHSSQYIVKYSIY